MFRGVIIKNGLTDKGSWVKRVSHWKTSFSNHNYDVGIISSYPYQSINNNDIYCLVKIKLPFIVEYFLSPFLIFKYLIKNKPDFILLGGGGFWEYFTVPLYCDIYKKILLVDLVDIIGRKYKKNKTFIDYIIIFNKKLFDKLIINKCLKLFLISTYLELIYKKMYPKKICRSIPSTVDLAAIKYLNNLDKSFLKYEEYNIFTCKESIKIFYAGTITRLNGIEFFLRTFVDIISNEFTNVIAIFAPLNGDINKLVKLITKYNLNDYVKIVPPIKQNYLPILLDISDILIIPEQGFETAKAGFPGKTAEYLASGNPIITTNFGDMGYFLKNNINAMICEIGDSEGYKNNLCRLIKDKELRKKIGANGTLLAEKEFNSINSALPYIKVIESYSNVKSDI